MRIVLAALLLSACISSGNETYLMVSDSADGTIVWHRFGTPEACEQARRESDIETRCVARRETARRYRLIG